jgi:hypothetical protein
MRNVTPSTRLRSGLSVVFLLFGLLFAVWETRLLWHHFVHAVRATKSRR